MSPCDSTGSPFAYVVRTRCTCLGPVKNPGLAFPTTSLHACSADITPCGSDPPPDIEPPSAAARLWPQPASSSMEMKISKIQFDRFITGPPLGVILLDAANGCPVPCQDLLVSRPGWLPEGQLARPPLSGRLLPYLVTPRSCGDTGQGTKWAARLRPVSGA